MKVKKLVRQVISTFLPKKLMAWNGRRFSKLLALTFDDGPNQEFTPAVLKILRLYGVPATFFLLGQAAEKHPHLVKEIALDGHAIGNHSYSHRKVPWNRLRPFVNELRSAELIIESLAGTRLDMYRPPHCRLSILHLFYCLLTGRRLILISLDSEDWRKDSAQLIKERVITKARGGDIVIFHDDNPLTIEAVSQVIDHFQRDGYQFVTIPDLIYPEGNKGGS